MLRTVVADCLLADCLCFCAELSDLLKNSSPTLQPIIPITAVLAVLVYPISQNLHLASACFPALGSGLKERSWGESWKSFCVLEREHVYLFSLFYTLVNRRRWPGSLEINIPFQCNILYIFFLFSLQKQRTKFPSFRVKEGELRS